MLVLVFEPAGRRGPNDDFFIGEYCCSLQRCTHVKKLRWVTTMALAKIYEEPHQAQQVFQRIQREIDGEVPSVDMAHALPAAHGIFKVQRLERGDAVMARRYALEEMKTN
jgi:hypothetical protein